MTLLEAWSGWRSDTAPYVLEQDRALLASPRSVRATAVVTDWQTAIRQEDFCAPGDSRLHLGLLPEPFCGDVRSATIFVLLLNPGLGPSDYYGEYEVPAFRAARLQNLQQVFDGRTLPFYMLDPKFSWHGGFQWWHRKLCGVIGAIAASRTISFAAAQRLLADQLASIELLPYHSATFGDADGWLSGLQSVRLAKSYVHDVIVPRVRRGDAIVIATRQVNLWGLPDIPGVIRYSAGQARGAHLTPSSPGGDAILRWMARAV